MIDNEFIIPIDKAVYEFRRHLLSHPRTILSAKFGDGKTYFLNKFREDESVKNNFTILTLYPINYQVAENRDIFELIKFDILLQLIQNDMIPAEYEIEDNLLRSFFIQHYSADLLTLLLQGMSAVCPSTPETKCLEVFIAAQKLVQRVSNKIKDFKKSYTKSGSIYKFIQETGNSFVYENDVITSIIRDIITQYHEKHKDKRVVLVVEDMDRLDPAHLFRILNVLSAHIDYRYRNIGEKDANWLNKFGVDNIVLVFDYKNTKRIFRHFYGPETDFEGYITKFCSNGYFSYSLAEERKKYIDQQIAKVIKLPSHISEMLILDADYDEKTIRLISDALANIDTQIMNHITYKALDKEIALHIGALQAIAFMRRLGVDDNEIKKRFISACDNLPIDMLKYIGGYILNYKNNGYLVDVAIKNKNEYPDNRDRADVFTIDSVMPDGTTLIQRKSSTIIYREQDKVLLEETLDMMLGCIGR